MSECDTTLDLMFERAVEKQWEEENQPAPAEPIESLSTKVRIHAYSQMDTARFVLELALENLGNAFEDIKSTPQGDKLGGMHDQLSDFIFDLKKLVKEVWGRYCDA